MHQEAASASLVVSDTNCAGVHEQHMYTCIKLAARQAATGTYPTYTELQASLPNLLTTFADCEYDHCSALQFGSNKFEPDGTGGQGEILTSVQRPRNAVSGRGQ